MTTLSAPHFVQGVLVEGDAIRHRSRDLGADFTTPAIDLDALVLPRSRLPPLLDVTLAEIVDYLVETGERLRLDRNPHLQECLELIAATNPLPRRVVENLYRQAPYFLTRPLLESIVDANFANRAALDGWVERVDGHGNKGAVRAFPPRMVHMLAGNAPSGCVSSIAQGALVKAVNLFKMPSSDPFTTVAVLRTMAEVDPRHPVVQSMSAVYWQGGDAVIERTLYRPQYFDKIVAWGGGDAINNVIQYLGPGIQLISFDPKSSISMIGREVFGSPDRVAEVADRLAADTTVFNQEACLASRYAFVEGQRPQVESFCAALAQRLNVDRDFGSAEGPALPAEVREEIQVAEAMGDLKVWGGFDGRGLVILSERPVEFQPSHKTSNVVLVDSLDDAVRYVNVATQTIGVYPDERKTQLRDRLASQGAQRLCRLGTANAHVLGSPHDAMYPLQRFVHWMGDDDITL
ncbi:long-chain-fatty-acyl-CoA reductase [Mycobacterium florentinum]|uniref:Acyl-CoA reductase n=1 Tax=Mycobacterium florentinum TaxID=292462 RepID=A0A1X1U3I8_MYCFL|nr:acyl-CoA reductase [Mycobacterium florentinum]MCV7411235.1 long-chain-fatty-acyl-CoA reductase [Mycobacterium florentinum]ORV51391.1 long-chain-fatty-acyl-CoA reductase [Mycobacterium florentinum]BBX80586.1 long-chain-fatty-acyl-CoA reductase [Mycobacterium florentinum]